MTTPSSILKVSVKDTPNLIWRRFVVPADIPFDRLHGVLQTIMSWRGTRPYFFEIRKELPETGIALSNLVSRSSARLKYRYGDRDHEISG